MSLIPPEIIRTNDAPHYVSVSPSQFFKLARQEGFPPKIRLGGRATGYRRSDLEKWLKSREVRPETGGTE